MLEEKIEGFLGQRLGILMIGI